jgi:hypothetical protein
VQVATYLGVVGDCYYANGTDISPGIYTRAITYQVLDQFGLPMSGRDLLTSVGTISEAIYNISGTGVTGNGTWGVGAGLRPNGQFWDYLHGSFGMAPSTAAQVFLDNGLPLQIFGFGGTGGILLNTYAAGSTALNGKTYRTGLVTIDGTISPRPCGLNGDPPWKGF